MTTKKRPPVWPSLGLGAVVIAAGIHAHNIVVDQQAALAEVKAAAYQSYVLEAHTEADLHNDARIVYLTGRYHDAQAVHATALEAANAAVASASGKVDATELTNALPGLSLVGDTQLMEESAVTLTTMAAALTEKVKAYDAEQARLKAEREAREAAERAAAEEAARQATESSYTPENGADGGGGGNGGGSGVDYTLYVAGWGGQDLIDACVGAVRYTYYDGDLAEHWSCGGSSFPQWAGAVVEIVGDGLYRTTGVIAQMDATVSSAYDAPGGYFYQTCLGGDSRQTIFIGLEPL